jgi:hypothetical protein
MDLDGALAAGSARSLEPGERLETSVAFVVYAGLDAVRTVARSGETIVVR